MRRRVFWVTVGKQHYPKAEDVPVVSNFGIGFSLVSDLSPLHSPAPHQQKGALCARAPLAF
jgi:Cu2+-containing amine oxidase